MWKNSRPSGVPVSMFWVSTLSRPERSANCAQISSRVSVADATGQIKVVSYRYRFKRVSPPEGRIALIAVTGAFAGQLGYPRVTLSVLVRAGRVRVQPVSRLFAGTAGTL